MGNRSLENIISATDKDYRNKLFRIEKAVSILYASNCSHSTAALDALFGIATIHRDVLFITVEIRDMKEPCESIKAREIHDQAGVIEYPTFVAYKNFVMKDKIVSKNSSAREQFRVLEKFISSNFPTK